MSFLEHLDELRTRLIRCVIALIVSFGLCAAFAKQIFLFAEAPILPLLPPGVKFAYTTLTQPFFLYMKVAFIAAIFLASPWILTELWLFVSPGLYRTEKKYAVPFIFSATILFLAGGAFGYKMVFPTTCRFFLDVGKDFTPVLKADEYLSLFSTVILGVGAVFEIPAVIFLLAKAGLVTPRFLLKNTRFAIVISFIVAAIVTPTPDPVTCTAVALPMIALYLLGVLVAALTYRPRGSRKKDDDEPTP